MEVVFIKQEEEWSGAEGGNSPPDDAPRLQLQIQDETRIKSEAECAEEDVKSWMQRAITINGLEIKPIYISDNQLDGNTSDNFTVDASLGEHFLSVPCKKVGHVCEVCDRSFTRVANLQRHAATHARPPRDHRRPATDRQHPCDTCGKLFKSTSNLNQHKRVHSTVRPYVCSQCARTFVVKANLVRHQTTAKCKPAAARGPLHCPVCDKQFHKEFLLRSHLRRHDPARPYTCDLCGARFKHKSTIARHLQWHAGAKPFPCTYCPKSFTHRGLLTPHLRVHTGEKPYQCPLCRKLFAHKHNMERHRLNHGRIKRLVCELCGKRFPRESRLIYHMRTHTNEKHFKCHVCDKTFSHKQNIMRHYTKKHPGAEYLGTDTDAAVALRVWERLQHSLPPHHSYCPPEEILG